MKKYLAIKWLFFTFANDLLLLAMRLLNSALDGGKRLEWCGFCLIFPAFYLPIGWGLTSVGCLGLLLDVFQDDFYGISVILLMANYLLLFYGKHHFYYKNDVQCLVLGFLFNGLWLLEKGVVRRVFSGRWEALGSFLSNAVWSQLAMLMIGWAFFKLQRRYLNLILGSFWERM